MFKVKSLANHGKFGKTGLSNKIICKSQKGTEQGVRTGKRSLLTCHSRHKYPMGTSSDDKKTRNICNLLLSMCRMYAFDVDMVHVNKIYN